VVYRVVLAEDHVLVREGIKKIIQDVAGLQVVGEASEGRELLELLLNVKPDLVILDISMPGLSGLEAAREIKRRHPGVKVLILTMHRVPEYLKDALAAGADGYLLKEDAARELVKAVVAVRQGELYVSPLLSRELAHLYLENRRETPAPPLPPLTPREIQIIGLIADGKSSREIAAQLYLSFRTVQNHRTRIMRKLNLRKNTDLVKYAILQGYVTAASP
jgi:DNA-binding NarL/FixJ family response regulator